MKRISKLTKAAVVLTLCASATTLKAEPYLYASAGGNLVKVDIGAGTTSVIGAFGEPMCSAIAIDPQGGLFTVSQGWPPGSPNPQLASVDLASGDATPFGANLNPEIFMGIGFSPDGKLHGVNAGSGTADSGSLYRFDPETGAATKVKVTGSCGAIMDLAWHPDGTMYGVDPWSLFRINPNTGEATLVVKTALTRIMGVAIDDDGNFYVSEILPNAPLLKLDPATGATTPVAGVSLNVPHGLEIIPTPRSQQVALPFVLAEDGDHNWSGTVDADSNGSPDGEITCLEITDRASGRITHLTADYTVDTPFYKFVARVHMVVNHSNGSIRGNGIVTQGWQDGTRVHLEAESLAGGFQGVMRLMPASASSASAE